MAENSDKSAKGKRRGAGRPWQKGQSGNPGGRPKTLSHVRERIQKRGDDLVDELFAIVDDLPRVIPEEKGPGVFLGPSHSDRIKAILGLWAYGYGKPVQAVELTGKDGEPIKTEDATPLGRTSEQKIVRLVGLVTKALGKPAGPSGGDSEGA